MHFPCCESHRDEALLERPVLARSTYVDEVSCTVDACYRDFRSTHKTCGPYDTSLISLIFIFGSMGAAVLTGTTIISVFFSLFMMLLDVLISFIQAYVFTILSTIFISLARARGEESHEQPVNEK